MSSNLKSDKDTVEFKSRFNIEYINNPPSKNFQTEDDFKQVFVAPIATDDEIKSLTEDAKEDLKKLVAIGMEQLFLSIDEGKKKFFKEFKSSDIPEDLEKLNKIVTFLLKQGVTFAKQMPKQNLIALLDETAASNLKHLSMFFKYIIKMAPEDFSVDDLLKTILKYLSQCYDIMSLDINDSDLFLSIPVFLQNQLEHFTSNIGAIANQHISWLTGFNIYLEEKLEKFISANPKIDKKKLKELVQFRGKLRLFQKQFPKHETTIDQILNITRIVSGMDFGKITRELLEKNQTSEMKSLLADLKGFQIDSLLDSSFENELYQTLEDQSTKSADCALNSPPQAKADVKQICDDLFRIFVSREDKNLIDEQGLSQLLGLLAEQSITPAEKAQKISQFLAQDKYQGLLNALLDECKDLPLKILTDAKKRYDFSKMGFNDPFFQEIQNLQSYLADYEPKNPEEKSAIDKLQVFFENRGLEKRIFGLPSWLEDNPDILQTLSPSPLKKCLVNILLFFTIIISKIFPKYIVSNPSIDNTLNLVLNQVKEKASAPENVVPSPSPSPKGL